VEKCVSVCVCVCVRPDGSSVWRPARGTGAGHMTSRYQGDGDCFWREDERRRAPGTERGGEGEPAGGKQEEREREGERGRGRGRGIESYSAAKGNAQTTKDTAAVRSARSPSSWWRKSMWPSRPNCILVKESVGGSGAPAPMEDPVPGLQKEK